MKANQNYQKKQYTQVAVFPIYCRPTLPTASLQACYENHFCPTGTGDPRTGQMADDAVNRGLLAEEANPFLDENTLKYLGDEVGRCASAFELSICWTYISASIGEYVGLISKKLRLCYSLRSV